MYVKSGHTAAEYKLPLLSETFHQAELDSDQQADQKRSWPQHQSVRLMKPRQCGGPGSTLPVCGSFKTGKTAKEGVKQCNYTMYYIPTKLHAKTLAQTVFLDLYIYKTHL